MKSNRGWIRTEYDNEDCDSVNSDDTDTEKNLLQILYDKEILGDCRIKYEIEDDTFDGDSDTEYEERKYTYESHALDRIYYKSNNYSNNNKYLKKIYENKKTKYDNTYITPKDVFKYLFDIDYDMENTIK